MSFASIQSAEYAAQLLKRQAADINQKPIGTGPFVFKSYQKDSNIRYTGNKDYWNPRREDRQPDLRHHHRPVGAHPEAQEERVPGHPVPASGRPQGAEGDKT
jgi:hypothetical protein